MLSSPSLHIVQICTSLFRQHIWLKLYIFFVAPQPYWGLGRLIVQVLRSHTAGHTTLGRIPLGERYQSVPEAYIHNRQISIPPPPPSHSGAGFFEPAIPASASAAELRLLDRAAVRNQLHFFHLSKNISLHGNTSSTLIIIQYNATCPD